jgi:hypothetical protein
VVPDHDAHAVGIRVGADDEVHAVFLGQLHRQIEALGILRVGGDHGGEVAVDDHLLRHAQQVLDAQRPQRLRHQLVAAAVERRVDELEGVRHPGHRGPVVGLGR